MSSIHALRRRALPLVAAALAAGLVVPATGAGAATPVRFTVTLDSSCVQGKGPASTALTIQIRKPSGKLADAVKVTSDGAGAFFGCFPKDTAAASGWKLSARKGRKVLRLVVLPKLSVFTDRTTDVVKGKGSVGAKLSIAVQDCNTDPRTCTVVGTLKTKVKANGGYSVDVTSTLDAIGNDRVEVASRTGAGDTIIRTGSFPFLGVGPEGYSGVVNRNQSINVVVAPSISLKFDSDTHVLSGKCLENRPVMVYWFDSSVHRVAQTTDAGGSFSVDLDPDPVPASGTTLFLNRYPAAGDRINVEGTLP